MRLSSFSPPGMAIPKGYYYPQRLGLFSSFETVPLETNILECTGPIFRMGTHRYIRDRSRDVAVITDFGAYRRTHLHSLRRYSTMDGKNAKRLRALTPPMTSLHNVKNPEFCRRVCASPILGT